MFNGTYNPENEEDVINDNDGELEVQIFIPHNFQPALMFAVQNNHYTLIQVLLGTPGINPNLGTPGGLHQQMIANAARNTHATGTSVPESFSTSTTVPVMLSNPVHSDPAPEMNKVTKNNSNR